MIDEKFLTTEEVAERYRRRKSRSALLQNWRVQRRIGLPFDEDRQGGALSGRGTGGLGPAEPRRLRRRWIAWAVGVGPGGGVR